MIKVENANKIPSIVKPNIDHFRHLYSDTIDQSPFIERTDFGYVQSARTTANLYAMEKYLPRKLLYTPEGAIYTKSRVMRFDKNADPKEQLFRKTAAGDNRYVDEQLRIIVMTPSIVQTMKGFVSAGLVKSVKYSAAKLKKAKGKKVDKQSLPAVVGRDEKLISVEYNTYKHRNNPLSDPDQKKGLFILSLILSGALLCVHYAMKEKDMIEGMKSWSPARS